MKREPSPNLKLLLRLLGKRPSTTRELAEKMPISHNSVQMMISRNRKACGIWVVGWKKEGRVCMAVYGFNATKDAPRPPREDPRVSQARYAASRNRASRQAKLRARLREQERLAQLQRPGPPDLSLALRRVDAPFLYGSHR